MSNDNILFSFYKYIKYKVNSFISNAFYSSRKNFQALSSIANMTNEHPKKQNNYIKYLISQKIQEIKTNNYIYPPPIPVSNIPMFPYSAALVVEGVIYSTLLISLPAGTI